MVVAIAGGALQGLEMTYLARKAGFETLLLDRRSDAPATGICHRFAALDLTDHSALTRALESADLVLPATENLSALQSMVAWCDETGMPLAFDLEAYTVSSSKAASDSLFRDLGIPAPTSWPDCAFPVLAKPDGESGSKGVEVFSSQQALEARFGTELPQEWVVQEYLSGPLFSVEVIGHAGGYTPLQITALGMDQDHSCKRVLAPSGLPFPLARRFEEMAVDLAEAVGLSGIMDVEAVLHDGELKVLEIDARFPSQTPIAVCRSTGVNMVERLAELFCPQEAGTLDPAPPRPPAGSVLEHIMFHRSHLSMRGEHIMVDGGPLHLERGFFGADEALTNYAPGREKWVATLMIDGSHLDDALERRDRVIGEIRNQLGVRTYGDESPQRPIGQGP
jgi:pyrrolysine biosynthesis protein PylC